MITVWFAEDYDFLRFYEIPTLNSDIGFIIGKPKVGSSRSPYAGAVLDA